MTVRFVPSFAWVALRKESVDRNALTLQDAFCHAWSLSARRAWIEIIWIWSAENYGLVALRKESVDRNIKASTFLMMYSWSLSARRAWIEILPGVYALDCAVCRSPQGERG